VEPNDGRGVDGLLRFKQFPPGTLLGRGDMSTATSEGRLGEHDEACARATDDQQLFEVVSMRRRDFVPCPGPTFSRVEF
jgi:hypothetical protein